jgi:regulator of protease activity HflC (stomatin/prohibitin superfamily)
MAATLIRIVLGAILFAAFVLPALLVRILREYERGVIFRLGRLLPQKARASCC